MKTITTFLMLLFSFLLFAQDEGFNYKALITEDGKVLSGKEIGVRFSLYQGSTKVYEETLTTQTDDNGIISVMIGSGTPTQGDFGNIDWNNATSLGVEIDAGSGYRDFGTNPFRYVPYAKMADKAEHAARADNVKFVDGKNPADAVLPKGSVGIGTNAPEEKLQIGDGTENVGIRLVSKGGALSGLKMFEAGNYGFEFQYNGENDKLYLWSRKYNGNEGIRMTWLKTGRTGLGTTSPVSRLHLVPYGNMGEGGNLDISKAGLFIGDKDAGIAIDDNEIESSNSNLYLNTASKKDVVVGQDLYVRDDIILSDNLKMEGKIEGNGTGFYDMKAFAYGNVNGNGKIKMATENVEKVTYYPTSGRYDIKIKNTKLDYANYACVATTTEPWSYPVILNATISDDGLLHIYLYQLSVVPAAGSFSFVIFKK
jgi:hypothetical protein